MTIKLKPVKGWAVGFFDPKDDWVYFKDPAELFATPQDVLDHVTTGEGRTLNLGPSGLIWIWVERTSRKATYQYFQSLTAAVRFHLSKSA